MKRRGRKRESTGPAATHTMHAAGRPARRRDASPAAALPAPVFRNVCDDGGRVDGNGAAGLELSMTERNDVFADADGRPRVLRGVCIYSNASRLAEMAARIGYETIWVEMEHGPAGFEQVEAMCMAIEAGGALPTVRVPDGQRHHVLRALEVGARIVVVPMVNNAQQAQQIVHDGKFPPLGSRGYNVRSRGVHYGLGDRRTAFAEANARTALFAQIETVEAVGNLEAICRVEGLSGVFIGPGDLSVSAGCPGDLNGPELVRLVSECVRRARALGKHAGILVPPGTMLSASIEAGCDLIFCGGDVTELAVAWPRLLESIPTNRGAVGTSNGGGGATAAAAQSSHAPAGRARKA